MESIYNGIDSTDNSLASRRR